MNRFLVPILLLIFAVPTWAQDQESIARNTRIAKQSATISGDRGAFTVSSVETLTRNQFSYGFGVNNFDRTPSDLDVSAYTAFFSYGLFDRLTVSAAFETKKQIVARNLSQTGFFNTMPFVNRRYASGYGDTVVRATYRLQRKADNVGGIALSGFVKLPTGKAEQSLGTGKYDGGLDLVFTSVLPFSFLLHSTMGLVATADPEIPSPITLKDEMRSGLGFVWPAGGFDVYGGGIVQGIFEYSTVTFIGAGTLNDVIQAPSDIALGVRYMQLDSGFTFNAGFRRNTNFDLEFPGNEEQNGFVFGVTYTKPVEGLSTNNFPLVVLETPVNEVQVGGSVAITANGFDVDNDPLSYAWTSSAGQVLGDGDSVTFDTTGLARGQYTVRAVVNDGRGGTAQSEITITVQ